MVDEFEQIENAAYQSVGALPKTPFSHLEKWQKDGINTYMQDQIGRRYDDFKDDPRAKRYLPRGFFDGERDYKAEHEQELFEEANPWAFMGGSNGNDWAGANSGPEEQQPSNQNNYNNRTEKPQEENPETAADGSSAGEGAAGEGAAAGEAAAGEEGAAAAGLAGEAGAGVAAGEAGAAAAAAGGEAAAAAGGAGCATIAPWVLGAIGILLILLLMGTVIGFWGGGAQQAYGDTTGAQTIICVDPGHPSELGDSTTKTDYDHDKASWESSQTGANGGTSGSGQEERFLNQQVADALVAELKSRGYDAEETKTGADTFMSNRDRGKFCQSKKASLIIKVHNDDGSGSLGMAFWYPDKGIINSKSSNPGGFNEYPYKTSDATFNDDVKIKDLMKKAFVEGQKKYGYTYASTTTSGSKNNNDGFGYVYDIPTTLIEMSHMGNADQISFIKNPANQQKIVKAFADGIEGYVPPSPGGRAINGVLNVPYWNQFRNDPNSCSGGTHWYSTSNTGCGATSAAMIVQFVLGKKFTPDEYNSQGGGNQWDCDLVNRLIKPKGVQYQCYVSLSDPEAALKNIEKSIQKGYPGVVHVDPPYACNSHVMVVTGFDAQGNVYINDPNCGDCGTGQHNESNQYMKVGTPPGKNDLAPRAKLKAAMRSHYEYVK